MTLTRGSWQETAKKEIEVKAPLNTKEIPITEQTIYGTEKSSDIPDIEKIKGKTFEEEAQAFQEKTYQAAVPGYKIAGSNYALPENKRLTRDFQETIAAGFRLGTTWTTLFGQGLTDTTPIDQNYDVRLDMTEQDLPYSAQFALSHSTEQTNELRDYINQRESDKYAASQRPWVSFLGAIADPAELAVDIISYSAIGRLVTLPLLFKTMRQSERGVGMLQSLAASPKKAGMLEEAILGAQVAVTSTLLQQTVKPLVSPLEEVENIGEHVFFGTLVGGALGGGIGLLVGSKARNLVNRFVEMNNLGQKTAKAPPPGPKMGPYENVSTSPFVGPKIPVPEVPAVPGKNIMRMQAKEEPKPKKTPEELAVEKERIKTEAEQLKTYVEGEGATIRSTLFEQLRRDFMQIGEGLTTNPNIPKPIRQALSLITAPYRNMSAGNRGMASRFGTVRMAVLGYVRNLTELAGTRTGKVIPRSVQNAIEDIQDWSISTNLAMHEFWMAANGVKPGAFAAESLALSEQKVGQKEFFRQVSTQMLHVGKPTALLQGASEHVQKAAKHLYETFYKPLGERLIDLRLIKEADIESTLNYLNRHWSTEAILNDPDGFKKWLGDFFIEQNNKHKSLRPQYDKGLDIARKLRTDSNRFNRAADKIESLEKTAEANYLEKGAEVQEKYKAFIEKTKEKFDDIREKIKEKYAKGVSEPTTKERSTIRRLIKGEIASYRNERDLVNKQYADEKLALTVEIKNIRSALKAKKRSIFSGSNDSRITKEFKDANVQLIHDNPSAVALTEKDIEEYAESLVENLDTYDIKQLRKEYYSIESSDAISKIEDLKSNLSAVKEEHRELLKVNKSGLDKDIKAAFELLQEEDKVYKAAFKQQNKDKINSAREKLELKLVDLKEKTAISKYTKDAIKQINIVKKPFLELQRLMRKYSNVGFLASEELKQAKAQAKNMIKQGTSEEQVAIFLKTAIKREREAIKNAALVREARDVADSLAEGSAIELKRAEDIIPDDLRSTKTGRPYRLWDEAEEPGYASMLAEKTMLTMLGQEDEIVLNPVLAALGPGQPSMFKPRNIKMPDDYPGIEQWVQRDCQILSNNFARGVAPVIGLTELMHELNKMPEIQMAVKRIQVLDPKIGPTKALNMKSEMVHYTEIPKVYASMLLEEFRILSKDLSSEALKKATKDYHNSEKIMVELYKETMGIRGNGSNVNQSGFSDFVDIVNSAATTVTNNNLVTSMLGDTMTPAIRYGFPKYIATLNKLASSPEFRALNAREAKALHRATRIGQGSILKSQITGREGSLKNSTIGRGVINLANRTGNITGANKLADMQETALVALVKSEFLNTCENIALGRATKKELTHLAQRGVSPEEALEIYDLWKRYGNETDGFKGIDPAAIENPSKRRATQYTHYQNFLNDEIKGIMARPGAGSLPSFASSPWGKMVLFLKRWFFAATNDVFVPAAQRMDAEAIQGFLGMFAMGFLQSKLRQLYRPNYEEKEFKLEGAIVDAITNAGFLGIYGLGLDALSTAQVINGNGGSRYDPSNGITSLIVGPGVLGLTNRTLAIMGKMRQIGTDEERQFNYKDFNYIANTAVPFWKWAPISTAVQPRLKEYFEAQGRGE